MAHVVMLKHPKTGIMKKGFFGFSWTTLFFGGFPAIFRGDLVIGLVFIVLQLLTWGFAGLVWAFIYNKSYTTKLIEQGYELDDHPSVESRARAKLGVVAPVSTPATALV